MENNFSLAEAAVLAAALIMGGCGRDAAPSVLHKGDQTSSNDVSVVSAAIMGEAIPPEPKSPDMATLAKARSALDSGDTQAAMTIARGLMDSKELPVRADLVDIFAWVGKKAMPELAEMMRDSDPQIAEAAVNAWEFALAEISHDYSKAVAITNIVVTIENPVVIDSILMHILDIELRYALPALQGLIVDGRGKAYGQCAKRVFEHAAGEPWLSVERTEAILTKEKESER